MSTILQSEFLWGLFLGLILSIIGAWAVAHFSFVKQQDNQKKLVKRLICDISKNISNIANELDETKNRTNLIYNDFLVLIDIEIGIYSRNREHLSVLPESDVEAIRKFFTEVATSRASVAVKLELLQRSHAQANQHAAAQQLEETRKANDLAQQNFKEAQQAADRLVQKSQAASAIIERLSR